MSTNKSKEEIVNEKNPIEKVMEVVGMDQEPLAKSMGLTRQTLSNYGKNPDAIPNKIIKLLMMYSGLSYEELFADSKSDDLLPFLYEPQVQTANEQMVRTIENIVDNKEQFIRDYLDVPESFKNKALDEIEFQHSFLKKSKRKSRVVIMGMHSVGKSTLASYLLGSKASSNVSNEIYTCPIVYKRNSNNPESEEKNLDNEQKKAKPIYVDSNLLDDIELIDLPSFDGYEETSYGAFDPDIVIFVSLAYENTSKDELLALKSLIEKGVDINKIIVVKNKACMLYDDLVKEKDLTPSGEAVRILQELISDKEHYDNVPSKEELEKRICYMDCKDPDSDALRKNFNELFVRTIRQNTDERNQRFIEQERDLCEERILYYGNQVTKVGEPSEDRIRLNGGGSNKEDAVERLTRSKKDLRLLIDECKKEAIKELQNNYKRLVNEQSIEKELLQNKARTDKDYTKTVIYRIATELRGGVEKQYNEDLVNTIALFNKAVNDAVEGVPQLEKSIEYDGLGMKYAMMNGKVMGAESLYFPKTKEGLSKITEYADMVAVGSLGINPITAMTAVVALGVFTGLSLSPGRAGVWEKKTARTIAKGFEEKRYLSNIVKEVEKAYDQLGTMCDYLKDMVELIKNISSEDERNIDHTSITAKVMLCQSMVEMYYSIKAIVEAYR